MCRASRAVSHSVTLSDASGLPCLGVDRRGTRDVLFIDLTGLAEYLAVGASRSKQGNSRRWVA